LIIDELFGIIKDNKWHDAAELADRMKIQTDKMIKILQVLSEKGLIKYKDKTHRIKIEPEWIGVLPIESEPAEPETTAAK